MKDIWGDRLTTVFPRQGHYALDSKNVAAYPPAALTIEHIGDLVNYDLADLLQGSNARRGGEVAMNRLTSRPALPSPDR
jgi:hypothetical protein